MIVSRSDAAFYRLRRMVAEGAALDVKVYLVRDDGQTRCDVNKYGALDSWPRDLFGFVEAECGAILRARAGRRGHGEVTMKRSQIEAEIARLRAAKPTAFAAFAEKRAARLVELEAALAAAPLDVPEPDATLEGVLRRSSGGDKFDRRR